MKKAAQAYRDEGFKAQVANVSAVEDILKDLEEERNDILGQMGIEKPEVEPISEILEDPKATQKEVIAEKKKLKE